MREEGEGIVRIHEEMERRRLPPPEIEAEDWLFSIRLLNEKSERAAEGSGNLIREPRAFIGAGRDVENEMPAAGTRLGQAVAEGGDLRHAEIRPVRKAVQSDIDVSLVQDHLERVHSASDLDHTTPTNEALLQMGILTSDEGEPRPTVLGLMAFGTDEWRDFLIRSVGLEPAALDERAKRVALLRMVPFVERNYDLVELGPRGTGKSHIYQQISPYSHLLSGGKATVAKMFVNMANGQRGLVCQYDVVCFDEVSGVSFDQKDGVNIMKGYMASGEFSRGKESIRADGGIVMVGNFDVDVEQQQRIGHLLSPLPKEMRDDTAFHDRIHGYAPGWDFPKLNPEDHLTDHFGLVTDFLSECWNQSRQSSRLTALQNRVFWGGALSGRDIEAVNKTCSGLLKLLHPDPEMPVEDDDMEWIVRLSLESRRRVKEQQKCCLRSEFGNTHFSFTLGVDGVEQFVATPELHSDEAIDSDPLPPGQVWAIGPGTGETGAGLYRIEVALGPGSGVKILNYPVPPAFRESVKVGEQNLYRAAKQLVGHRDPRGFEYSIQLRSFDADKSGLGLGMPVLAACVGALLDRGTRGGAIVVGPLNLGGSLDMLTHPVLIAELAVDKRAATLLMPVSARKALNELPDELWTKVNIEYYSDPVDGVFKALLP